MFSNIIFYFAPCIYILKHTTSWIVYRIRKTALRGRYEKSHTQQYRSPERKQLEREGCNVRAGVRLGRVSMLGKTTSKLWINIVTTDCCFGSRL